MIDQDVWREGLTAPDYDRIVHTVGNIIIHHSAGSILSDNYYEVVRGIYLFHTVDRQWSDIGYNYLIANDGTIFKGRDPGEYEQDNVMGAHFCNNNSGTMGICVIGTYTDTIPSSEAIYSLISLLTWKVVKDDLNPVSKYAHPLNDTLPVIAGHRDGCATECPGQKFYEMFPVLRQQVNDSALQCPGWEPNAISSMEGHNDIFNVYPNPANNIIYFNCNIPVEKVIIFDMLGRNRLISDLQTDQDSYMLDIQGLSQGLYNLILYTEEGILTERFVVY